VPRSGQVPFLLALGVVAAAVTALNAYLARLSITVSQALMAAYFIWMMPLCQSIRVGFYDEGVWADAGFLRYTKIGRIAFRETPEIVRILLPRGRSGSFGLPVPPERNTARCARSWRRDPRPHDQHGGRDPAAVDIHPLDSRYRSAKGDYLRAEDLHHQPGWPRNSLARQRNRIVPSMRAR
jgi:hypothetical protein